MLVLAAIGLGVASYLTYTHYAHVVVLCTTKGHGGESGCETVQHSVYSTLAGIPVAVLGLVGYVAILASLLAAQSETTRFATAGFALVGFGFSAYLTSRELFTIHAICEWCVSSAIIMTILVCFAIWRFLAGKDGEPLRRSAAPSAEDLGSGETQSLPPLGAPQR